MKVLIADDHDLLKDALLAFFEADSDIEVHTASTVDEACDSIQKGAVFDVVLLDYQMPGMNGLEGLERALRSGRGARVALMSGVAGKEIAEKALEAGAAGFVPKTLPAKSMVNAVRFMAMGERFVPPELMSGATQAAGNALAQGLSKRELQVLGGLTEGKSNKEIARDLSLQEPTVKLHVKTLYRKIGAANRTQAALIAREAGLF